MPDTSRAPALADHPLRYQLANELHARPFPALDAPCFAAFLAIKEPENAAGRDRSRDRAHLLALLDRFGAQHPKPDATHWFGEIGRYRLKWEQHTEFVTYTIFGEGVADRPFDPAAFDVFPEGWLADAPGVRMTSMLIRVEEMTAEDAVRSKLAEWFVPESLATSWVLDRAAAVAADFRIDHAGHVRMAVFAQPGTGPRRIGRIVQRLCEIETYKAMSMLGLARVRAVGAELGGIDRELTSLMADMTGEDARPEATLKGLLVVSAELENLLAQTSFRFGATGAYEALVNERISVLREERFEGRQTFGEFMRRRYDPSMRTVQASRKRLGEMAERAARAGDLLRTQVDVERSAQNQQLLASMDKRADQQLQLQKTVEGLSTVAISYYAVNLFVYLLGPAAASVGIGQILLYCIVTPLVLIGVWLTIRRIRRTVG